MTSAYKTENKGGKRSRKQESATAASKSRQITAHSSPSDRYAYAWSAGWIAWLSGSSSSAGYCGSQMAPTAVSFERPVFESVADKGGKGSTATKPIWAPSGSEGRVESGAGNVPSFQSEPARRSVVQDLTIMVRTMPGIILGVWGQPDPEP